jgi:O-antigen/teichoic acid export membrane protein
VPPSLKRRLLAGGAWVVTGKVITAVSRLAATALLARLLTQEEMGAFGLAFSFVIVGAMAGQLGLQQAVVRLVAESLGTGRRGRARAAVRAVYRHATGGTLAVAAFLLLGGGSWLALRVWDSPLLAASMTGLVVWVFLWSYQVLTSETFRGFQDLRSATIFGGVISWVLAAGLLFAVWLARGELTFDRVILIIIVSTALSLLPALYKLRLRVRGLPPGGSMPRGELLSISIPMWVTALTGFALAQSDLWILGAFVPKDQIAVYFSEMQLVALVSMSLMLVNLVVPPFIADLYARGEKRRLQRVLRTTASLAGIPAFLVLLAFVFFGAPILGFVYGPAFREGAIVLALLSLGKLVNVWTGSCGVTMSMTGHQTRLMAITMITSTLTVAGCLAVVRPHGMIGVASVVAAGTVLQNLAMWIGTRYFTGLWTHVGLPRWREVRELIR